MGLTRGAVAALLILLAAFVAPIVSSGHVSACSCVELTDAEAFQQADVVFTGRLIERRVDDGEIIGSMDPAYHVFAVDSVLKGDAFEVQSVVSARDGASCGLELPVGSDAVVYARTRSQSFELTNGELDANLCSGSRAGAAPVGLGTPMAPTPGASSVGDEVVGNEEDNTVALVTGMAIVIAALGLAATGLVKIVRARRTRPV